MSQLKTKDTEVETVLRYAKNTPGIIALLLTAKQEADIQKIMGEMDCSAGFSCYNSGFEDLTPVRVLSYGPVECLRAKESHCPVSFGFSIDGMRCECPLRRYVALELGK